jgi:uncharacterized protein YecT (DUF1311 family)
MNKIKAAVFLAGMSASAMLLAQTADPCVESGSTFDERACAQQKLKVRDALLNRTYQELLLQLASYDEPGGSSPSSRELLIAAQRKWIAFREADCKAQESVYKGGSIHAVIYLDCIREHTEQRIKDLKPTSWQAG